MRKTQFTAVIFLAVVLSMFAFFSYSPSTLATAAQNPEVRFTIDNQSNADFTISLYGEESYHLHVAPESSAIFLVMRDTYSYNMDICGFAGSGSINLNIFQTMHVPVCGGNALFNDKPHDVDASDVVKIVRVTIENNTFEDIGLYLRTLDVHHFLNLGPQETIEVITPRDRYVFSYVACEELVAGYYEARVMKPLILDCP